MNEEFDIKLALRVFDKVTTMGVKDGDNYTWSGLTAWSDRGGYTITLADGVVTLTVNFHNTYEFDTENGQLLDEFIIKLKALDSHSG